MALLAISICSAFADMTFRIVKCQRYGTDVLITFNVENTNSWDVTVMKYPGFAGSSVGGGIVVLDAEGNQYKTADFTYGQTREYSFDGSVDIAGGSSCTVPIGREEISSSGFTVPSEMNINIKVVARNVPRKLEKFSLIEIYGTYSWGGEDRNAFSVNFSSDKFPKDLAIETVK